MSSALNQSLMLCGIQEFSLNYKHMVTFLIQYWKREAEKTK